MYIVQAGWYQLHPHHRLGIITQTMLIPIYFSKGWIAWWARAQRVHITFTQGYYTIERHEKEINQCCRAQDKVNREKMNLGCQAQDFLNTSEPTIPHITEAQSTLLALDTTSALIFNLYRRLIINDKVFVNYFTWAQAGFVRFEVVHPPLACLQRLNHMYQGVTLATTFPRRTFTEDDMSQTLLDLELVPSAALVVLPSVCIVK